MTDPELRPGDYTGPGVTRFTEQVPSGERPSPDSHDDRSVGEIVGDIAQDLGDLVKQELELAKTEARQDAKRAGRGAGMLGGAGVAGHLMLLFLSLALMFLLDNWMHIALAALIVTVVWGVVVGVLALRGKQELESLNPPLETTQRTLKEDVQWAKDMKNG